MSDIDYFAEVWKGDPIVDKVLARIADLEAEIERLKVCGNCAYWKLTYPRGRLCTAEKQHEQTWGCDGCHFAPSRWTERETP